MYIYSVKESMAANSTRSCSGKDMDTSWIWIRHYLRMTYLICPIWWFYSCLLHRGCFNLNFLPRSLMIENWWKARAKSKDENVYLTEYVESSIISKYRLGRYTCRQYATRQFESWMYMITTPLFTPPFSLVLNSSWHWLFGLCLLKKVKILRNNCSIFYST